MKLKLGLYFFIFFISFFKIGFSQVITAHAFPTNVGCNHHKLGKLIIVIADPTNHPPYIYTYSNGVVHTGGITDSISDLDVGNYSVTITDSQDSEIGATSGEIIEEPCEVIPANLFTPNEDTFYDTWFIQNAEYFPDMHVLVYSRLGQLVYEHKGVYEEWDGRDKHHVACPDAAYYYLITQDPSDKKHIVKGCVNIVR